MTKRFDFFNFLKRFCPLNTKNVFILVLAHLEPELALFDVNDIGNDGDDDLSHNYIPNFKQLFFLKKLLLKCPASDSN